MENPYDDYPRLSHSIMESAYPPLPNPGSHSPSELEIHKMLHERIGPTMQDLHPGARDVIIHRNEMNGTHHYSENIHDQFVTQHQQEVINISNERSLGGTVTAGGSNPIDSLMYMQSNFFST